jgi:hypothetical protein
VNGSEVLGADPTPWSGFPLFQSTNTLFECSYVLLEFSKNPNAAPILLFVESLEDLHKTVNVFAQLFGFVGHIIPLSERRWPE